MKTIGWRALMIAATVFPILAGSLLQAQPDKIVLDQAGKTRPAVIFPHNRHMEAGVSCKDCHHVYENGKNVLEEGTLLDQGNQAIRCSVCHDSNSSLDLKQAFHNQCLGCHKAYLNKNEKAGSRYCGGCHVRK